MVTFVANQAVDMLNLDELDGLTNFKNLHFSNAGIGGFTASPGGGVDLEFGGELFLYVPFTNRPFAGTVNTLKVTDHNVAQYNFSDVSVSIGNISNFTKIPTLFNGADNITGSNSADTLYGENGADKITGRSGNDTINGGAGNDTINGGVGGDRQTGGGGNDTFVFNSAINANDRITDFKTGHDKIQLENRIFGGIGDSGPLDAAQFHIGDHTTSASQHILYNPTATTTAGILYYVNNGAQHAFAFIDGGVHVDVGDLFVV